MALDIIITCAGTPGYGLSREQLAYQCPEALPRTRVVGDPCFDRLLASVAWRRRYRAALGLRDGRRLVLATSAWGPRSLLGRRPELIAQILAELPVDEYAVAAVVHPNVWHHHGPWQLRSWLADCRRAGLLLIPPREGWRAALVASDDPKAGGRIADEAFAFQGRSLAILRAEMYRLMRLDPPSACVRVPAVPPPVPEPRTWEDAERPALLASVVIEESPGRVEFVVERVPAEMVDLRAVPLRGSRHLVVDGTEPDRRLREIADIVIHRAGVAVSDDDAVPMVAEAGDGECRVRLPGGGAVRLRAASGNDPGLLASVVHAWLSRGRAVAALPPQLVLRVGGGEIPFTCDVLSG